MPVFEFSCSACDIEFEELLTQADEVRQFSQQHPCPECGGMAPRAGVSLTNFAFKAPVGRTQGTGVHGQSGVHDLDYPSLDKAVGRSSTVKWGKYGQRKEARDRARRELGTNAVTQIGDRVVAASDTTLKVREKALTTLEKAKKTAKDV